MFLTASRLLVVGLAVPGAIVIGPATASAQPEPVEPPKTRAEVIQAERREKVAELWPERESPLVVRVNQLVERGFKEGLDSGEGADGPQIVLGGMRSGQGFSFGVGYRRGRDVQVLTHLGEAAMIIVRSAAGGSPAGLRAVLLLRGLAGRLSQRADSE